MNIDLIIKQVLVVMFLIFLISSNSGCLWENEPEDMKKNIEQKPLEYSEKVAVINNNTLIWLVTLDVDPVKLRYEMGIKGKKKFVELLDIYLVLYQTASDIEKKTKYKLEVETLIQVIYNDSYHDMNEINDTQFRQDSTSYLRAWYIITEFGFNTDYYMEYIGKVIQRIDNHLPTRGINQRMAFVFYYDHLGYPIMYTMEELFNQSVIRKQTKVENLTELDVYFITHEIFMLYDDNKLDLLLQADFEYLKNILPVLVNMTIADNNIDLLAELIMIMTYLGFDEMYEYELAVEYLLSSQNPNGSFGAYEHAREYYESQGIDVDIQLYLHTTEVSIRALNEAIGVYDK